MRSRCPAPVTGVPARLKPGWLAASDVLANRVCSFTKLARGRAGPTYRYAHLSAQKVLKR